MKRSSILLLLTAVACSSSSRPSASPPEAQTRAVAPTPGALSRINPNIVEETDTYIIERLPKADYIRVDDRHLRHPVIGIPVEFFKEDDEYYYVITQKKIPEEESLKRELEKEGKIPAVQRERKKPESAVPLSDFTDIALTRVSGRLKLDPAAETGLPAGGMWRSSFVVADINGDGIPDIVAPSPRMGDNKLHVWLGDGKGSFSEWPLIFRQNGKPAPNFAIGYGGVAVGDIDGDGKVDVVCAWHGGGLVSLFGDGKGGFEIERTGLPAGRDFSAQAVVLLDADGDGKLDIVASRDIVESNPGQGLDYRQIRVYLYRGKKGWEFKSDGLIGGLYSNSLTAWDYDGDGRKDVLTGSHYSGGLTLIWKNAGNATFTPVLFKAIEIYAYHFASAPGTFGKSRVPAFADAYLMQTNTPESARAAGITLYAFADGEWTRHRVWRKKDGKSLLYALAMGDLDGDGLDDVVFADSEERRLRVFFQQPDGSFVEVAENEEPALDSPGQCVRLADLDGDGRLDVVLSKTITAADPRDKGGWNVYLNKVK